MEPVESACVCTALRMTTRTIKTIYDRALAPAGLTQTSYSLMARLAAEGPFTINQLATRLAMDRSTCSRELQPLLAAGFAKRSIGNDRRERFIALTPTGRRQFATAQSYWKSAQEQVARRFGASRTRAILDELHDLLRCAGSLSYFDINHPTDKVRT